MAEGFLDRIKKWWVDNKSNDFPLGQFPNEEHPNYHSYQERFTRTPGTVVPVTNLPVGVLARYLPEDNLILSTANSTSDTISHEAAHSIYNQANLGQYTQDLNAHVTNFMNSLIGSSGHYAAQIKQDPTTLSNEALGYSMNSPGKDDEVYVKHAASLIKDEILKQRLLNLFQHAQTMKTK